MCQFANLNYAYVDKPLQRHSVVTYEGTENILVYLIPGFVNCFISLNALRGMNLLLEDLIDDLRG